MQRVPQAKLPSEDESFQKDKRCGSSGLPFPVPESRGCLTVERHEVPQAPLTHRTTFPSFSTRRCLPPPRTEPRYPAGSSRVKRLYTELCLPTEQRDCSAHVKTLARV